MARCALVVAVASVGPACTERGPDEPTEIMPLERTGTAGDVATARSEMTDTAHDGAPTGDAPTTPDTEPGPAPADDEVPRQELRAELDAALLAYDRALTTLVGDPSAADDPLDPRRIAWDRAVGPSTAFSSEMLVAIRRRFEQERVVIRPDSSGLAYRHHALEVTRPTADTISFTWCGHSPGIGHDADSGAIVDDGVAHAHGTGMASRVEDRWRIDSLDEFELTVLAPGSPDPCPTEVAAVEQRP